METVRTHGTAVTRKTVRIPAGRVVLDGDLSIPRDARGVVVFAHGSGSTRLSPRNRRVAEYLQDKGFATLLFDLLTLEEEEEDAITAELRFDICLLARRLGDVTAWVRQQPETGPLPLGYFGASTGAAAALVAASRKPESVRTVVSRGGRPDLAAGALSKVRAPVLLIVGGEDYEVIGMNQTAAKELVAPHDLQIVPGATHLFEEPGALEQVAVLAERWFREHLKELREGCI
jgi:dienelactone hydrolase